MRPRFFILALAFSAGLLACRKTETIQSPSSETSPEQTPVCYDCEYLRQAYADVEDHATQLGGHINNPYLIENMMQAYKNLKGQYPAQRFSSNYLYIEFRPADFQQLDQLEEKDVDLFDYPLDQKLLTEGDYFLQPGKSIEDIPSYYAVVPANFSFPAGIPYRVIDEMFIPGNDPELEIEALRITNNLDEDDEPAFSNNQLNKKRHDEDIADSYGHSSSATPSCRNFPSGQILVQNALLVDNNYRGVREVRVVVRRLFKVERLVTDAHGNFACNKYFHNKFTVLAKFKDKYARISRMRPWAIHEQFFPIKINFGRWKNLDCGHEFRIEHPAAAGTIATSHWCAAITQNGLIEHHEMCNELNIGTPPMGLTIMLSSEKGSGHGNTYMLNKMLHNNAAVNGAEVLLASVITILNPFAGAAAAVAAEAYKYRAPDIKYGYGDDLSYLTTDRYCELVYHELSHALHYNAVGNDWWIKLGMAENKNPGVGTYGECCTDKAPRIALAEGWAYYMGHLLADKKWGMSSTSFPEQGDFDTNRFMLEFSNTTGNSSHQNFLETYDPFKIDDPNHWIPKGLFYDLTDSGTEPLQSRVVDEVSGFQCKHLFTALHSGAADINEYKLALLRENHNYMRDQVINLFHQYGY